MKDTFDIEPFSNSKFDSLDCNAFSRIRNLLVRAIKADPLLLKIIVIIPDDDLASYFNPDDTEVSKNLGKVINWILVEFDRIVAAHKDKISSKSTKSNYPTFVWIEAPIHDNFPNNKMRVKFNKALNTVSQFHDNIYSLKLKKVWNEHDTNLFLKNESRFTFSRLHVALYCIPMHKSK